MRHQYKTSGTCSQAIEFDLEDNIVKNVTFFGGCNGNLKAIAKLVDGMTAEEIKEKLNIFYNPKQSDTTYVQNKDGLF